MLSENKLSVIVLKAYNNLYYDEEAVETGGGRCVYECVCESKAHKIGHCWTLSDWTKIYGNIRFRQK